MNEAEYFRSRLRYDDDTGLLYWRYCPEQLLKWNSRHADKPAGGGTGDGYKNVRLDYKLYLAHRVIYLMKTGEWPPDGFEIDHRDAQRDNNVWSNLRLVTRSQNLMNARPRKKKNSRFKGVCFSKLNDNWTAHIRVNNEGIWLGAHDNEEDAYAAYCAASKKYHGVFGRVA